MSARGHRSAPVCDRGSAVPVHDGHRPVTTPPRMTMRAHVWSTKIPIRTVLIGGKERIMSAVQKAAAAEQSAYEKMVHAQAVVIALQLELDEETAPAGTRERLAKLRRERDALTTQWQAAARHYETVNERQWASR